MLQFQNVNIKDLAKGVDLASAESALEVGYAETLLNTDTVAEGILGKRRGYQGYYGYVPLRVHDVKQDGTNLTLCFDTSLNLVSQASSPLVVYGRLGSPTGANITGDWDNVDGNGFYTDTVKYYPTFTVDARKTITTGADTTILTHNEATSNLLTHTVASTSTTNLSNINIFTDSTSVDKTGNNDVTVETIVGGAAGFDAFIVAANRDTVAGQSYSADFVAGDFTANVLTISAATHGLENTFPNFQLYEDTGSAYEVVYPDDFLIETNGDIKIVVSSTFDGKIVLSDTGSRVLEAGVSGSGTQVIQFTPDTGAVFYTTVYSVALDGSKEWIVPDSVEYDADLNIITVTVVSSGNLTDTFQIVYEPLSIEANCITVQDTGSIAADFVDADMQMTVWGIKHEGNYNETTAQQGHCTYIDTYRRRGEGRVLTGLGGNIFRAMTRSEVGTAYNIPQSNVSLNSRVAASTVIGPVFFETGATTAIARAIKADNIDGNIAEIESATFTGTSGQVKLVLNLVNKTGSLIGITTDDRLNVSAMSFSKLNGSFKILAVDDSENSITVSIPSITTEDFNTTGECGKAEITTNKISLNTLNPFMENDYIENSLFDAVFRLQVVSTSGLDIVVQGATSELTLAPAIQLNGRRTSDQVPLESVTNMVVGDMCTFTGFNREFRILNIDTTNSIITLDESVEFAQERNTSVTLAVVGRWIPIEAPLPEASERVVRQHLRHFRAGGYSEQNILRSTMLNDTLLMTNGEDEIMKFDGENIYRAGLPRVQPHLFASLDTSVGSIDTPSEVATVSGGKGTKEFTVDTNLQLTVGDQFVHTADNAIYSITGVSGTTVAKVNTTITGANSGALIPLRQLRYYFRFHAIDANQNIITSATVGADDFIINLTEPGRIRLRLLNFPTFDAYNVDTIDIRVYRANATTAGNLAANDFFLVASTAVKAGTHDNYLDIIDSADGIQLQTRDETETILGEGNLGNTWSQPLRAKHITASANRLLLANITDYPEISIQLRKKVSEIVSVSDLVGKIWTVRKQGTSTTTDLNTTINFEYVDDSSKLTVTGVDNTIASDTFEVTTSASHGLSIGDWVYLYHSTVGVNKGLEHAGLFQISSTPAATTFQVHSNTGTTITTNQVDSAVVATNTNDIPVLLGTDGNYNNTTGNDNALSYERIAMIRLSNTINCAMMSVDRSLSGQSAFVPWVNATAGSEDGVGVLILRAPIASNTSMNVALPTTITSADYIAQGVLAEPGDLIINQTREFPSRVTASYTGFGETFLGPYGRDDDSENVFDINPSDGQEITGIISFFGHSPFSSAQLDDMAVVFKENSIYVLNLATGTVKQLETHGVGCSAPYSVAFSKNGIIFAHQSGPYRLNKDLSISYVGQKLQRFWESNLEGKDLSLLTGTQFSQERQYKLSIPVNGTNNNQVLVYDHEIETSNSYGSWAFYDNHNTTGWANLDEAALFSTSDGQVFKIRDNRDETDFRDDAEAISQEIVLGATDLGIAGTLKVFAHLVLQFQLRFSDLKGAEVSSSMNLNKVFLPLDSFALSSDNNDGGLDQQINPGVRTVKFAFPQRRGEFVQIKLTNSTKDEDMRLAGLTYIVGLTSSATIPQAITLE